jgi:hypothetical protein
VFFTELDRANWTLVLYTEESETTRVSIKNQTVFLSSLNLSDSRDANFKQKIVVSFSARLPEIQKSGNMTVLSVRQIERSPGGDSYIEKFRYAPMVVNCPCIPVSCYEPEYLLEPFRDKIREKEKQGIDTFSAEEKYREAEQLLYSAASLPSTHYVQKLQNISQAKEVIAEGERLLDKASADKEITDIYLMINKTDTIIGEIPGNSPPLEIERQMNGKRNNAIPYINAAIDQIAVGNYSAARENIGRARVLLNESYDTALEYREMQLMPTPAAPHTPLCCIIGVLIAGIFWWKKGGGG